MLKGQQLLDDMQAVPLVAESVHLLLQLIGTMHMSQEEHDRPNRESSELGKMPRMADRSRKAGRLAVVPKEVALTKSLLGPELVALCRQTRHSHQDFTREMYFNHRSFTKE